MTRARWRPQSAAVSWPTTIGDDAEALWGGAMTIDQRLADAEFLWHSQRHEGAFLMALVVFAATARKAYPKARDRAGFELLFAEQFRSGTQVRYPDKLVPMSELFYQWLRNQLVHEGGLPPGLSIDAEDVRGLFTVGLVDGYPVSISATWYHSLIISVIGHPVNADVFPRQEEALRAALEQRRAAGQRVLGVAAKLVPEPPPEFSGESARPAPGSGLSLGKRPLG
jgi:hypothetical protein